MNEIRKPVRICFSGRKRSGKDTCARLVNEIISDTNYDSILSFNDELLEIPEDLKFADTLKDILCTLTGCTREQLEDEDFKNSKMDECWKVWKVSYQDSMYYFNTKLFATFEEAHKLFLELASEGGYLIEPIEEYIPTYREALKYIGTPMFRHMWHPNTWINSTMNKVKEGKSYTISDVRFPNEAEACKEKDFIIVRLLRDANHDTDETESSLDNYNGFDEIIDNTREDFSEKELRSIIYNILDKYYEI